MNSFRINGGIPLRGEVKIQGSKNAALPILAATILIEGTSVIHNCPKIADVFQMQQLLSEMGSKIHWEKDSLVIDTRELSFHSFPKETMGKMRSTITLLGAMLGRFSESYMDYPGGCVIGERPIDLHISALELLGVSFTCDEHGFLARTDGMKGTDIYLRFPSVGATENAILAAVKAKGITRLYGAAKEPEVMALCSFLRKLGCSIQWCCHKSGTEYLNIYGITDWKRDVEFTVPSDRIVAGTYLLACMGAGGEVYLKDIPVWQLEYVISLLSGMGASLTFDGEGVYMKAPTGYVSPEKIVTAVYPGFPTDLQSPMMTVLTRAENDSVLEESIFENRFRIAEELNRMGAQIAIEGGCAKIKGQCLLRGEAVEARELRGGAALVIAGLMADGITTVNNRHYIERGYENISRDLRELGARISFE